MTAKKQRNEIPPDVAAEVLFLADRTCCVCREWRRPVQLHHIDNDRHNSVAHNLAVLCFDCHRDTQIRGGFDRKLDAAQVQKYKADWIDRVEARRQEPRPLTSQANNRVLRYLQLRERSDEYSYDFEADYVLVGSADPAADSETNAHISTFVTAYLQNFRTDAMASVVQKNEMKQLGMSACAWDSLAISHNVRLYTSSVLSVEFQLASYGAGAAHPNTGTKTLNLRLQPSMELQLRNMFQPSTNYVDILSRYCVEDLHRQQPQRWHDAAERAQQLRNHPDDWILQGAGAAHENYERFSLDKSGMVIHFDPYQVGSYAEGKYEVVIPAHALRAVLQEDVAALLAWT